MTIQKGRKYIYQFNTDVIFLVPLVDEMKTVSISSHDEEDFSIFSFGPEVCKEVEMGIKEVIIEDVGIFNNCIMRVCYPNPGNNIWIIIRDFDGEKILEITDILTQYNRGEENVVNTRTAEEDNSIFVDEENEIEYEYTYVDTTDYTKREDRYIDDDKGGEDEPGEEENPPEDEFPKNTIKMQLIDGFNIIDTGEYTGMTYENNHSNNTLFVQIIDRGTYYFEGSCANLYIKVLRNCGNVQLFFTDCTIVNSELGYIGVTTNQFIHIEDGNEVYIHCVGENTVTCPRNGNADQNLIYMGKGERLIFNETGSLTLKNCSGRAIYSLSPTYINTDLTLYINGSGNNAIECADTKFNMSKGTLKIDECKGDGVRASEITFTNSNVDIDLVYDNYNTSIYSTETDNYNLNWIDVDGDGIINHRINKDQGSHKCLHAGITPVDVSYQDVESDAHEIGTTYYTRAYGSLNIYGGTFRLSNVNTGIRTNVMVKTGFNATLDGSYVIGAPDTAIYSGNNLTITSGKIEIYASGNAIESTSSLTIRGDDTDILIDRCYKGIVSKYINIGMNGEYNPYPKIHITSQDTAVDAVARTFKQIFDSDNDSQHYNILTEFGNDSRILYYNGTLQVFINSLQDRSRTIGEIEVTTRALGHGIYCNNLFIYGGQVEIFGQSEGDGYPIYPTESYTLGVAANVIACGTDPKNTTIPTNGEGAYVIYGNSGIWNNQGGVSTIQVDGGRDTTVIRGSGVTVYRKSETLAAFSLEFQCNFLFVNSSNMTAGLEYMMDIGNLMVKRTAISSGSN